MTRAVAWRLLGVLLNFMAVDGYSTGCSRVMVPWRELVRAECAVPSSAEDVVLLAEAILDRERDYWIVVLTARRHESVPAVSPVAVREIVGSNVPLYFLGRRLAIHLSSLLPSGLDVQGGTVRVYRLGARSDPWAHPRLRDRSGEYGQDVLSKLGEIFVPRVAGVPELSLEQRLVVLEHELKRVGQEHARELGALRSRYEARVFGRHGDEWSSRSWLGGWWTRKRARRDLEDEMRLLIAAQWASFLPNHARGGYRLGGYTMTPEFLSDVARRVGKVSLDRVALLCSLVACGFEPCRAGFRAGPLRPAADASQLTREGGASAWWCNLHRRSHPVHGARLVYWVEPQGACEFVAVGYARDMA
jgi:hypothetical protein